VPLSYYFLDTPIECGIEFNRLCIEDGYPTIPNYRTNAFAWFPNTIYATYNSDIISIGHHEDAHILTYEYFKTRTIRFIEEGISVSFDNYWLGLPLHNCSHYILFYTDEIEINSLVSDSIFMNRNDLLTYPIAGSFIKWIISNHGMDTVKEIYINSNEDENYLLQTGLISDYLGFLKELTINEDESIKIIKKLRLERARS
jgi:hypothetical protein